jgi:hypothetical protein
MLEQHNGEVSERDAASIERCFDRIKNIPSGDPQTARLQTLRIQFDSARRVENYQ